MLQVGDPAPSFALPGSGGREVTLSTDAGRKTVVFFYPKDDTSGCTLEAKDFTALASDFAEIDTDLIGVSPDGPKSHDKFIRKHGLEVTLASDESKDSLQAYGVWAEKSMYGRKYMGVERTTFLVDADGTIARIWRKVSVPGHAAEVLAAARAL